MKLISSAFADGADRGHDAILVSRGRSRSEDRCQMS